MSRAQRNGRVQGAMWADWDEMGVRRPSSRESSGDGSEEELTGLENMIEYVWDMMRWVVAPAEDEPARGQPGATGRTMWTQNLTHDSCASASGRALAAVATGLLVAYLLQQAYGSVCPSEGPRSVLAGPFCTFTGYFLGPIAGIFGGLFTVLTLPAKAVIATLRPFLSAVLSVLAHVVGSLFRPLLSLFGPPAAVSTQPTSSLDWFSISRAASRQAGGAWAFVTEGMPRPPDPKLTPAAPLSLRLPSIGVGAALSRVAGAPRAVLSAAGALYARATSLYDLLFLQPDSPDGPVGLLVRLGVTPARLPWLLTAAIVVTTAVSLAARFSADDRATPRSFVRKSPALKVLRACLLAGFSAWAAWMAWTCLPLDAALSLTAGVVAVESLLPLVLGVAIVWSRGGPDRSVARGRGGALASLLVGSQGGVQWDVSPVLEAPAESDYGKTIESMSVQQLLSVLYPGQDWRNMPPELSADPSNIRKEVLQERSLAWAMARPVRMLSESLADASRTALPAWAKAIVAGTIVRAGRVLSSPISLVFEHKQGASALSEAGQVVLDLRSIRHALSAAGVPAAAMETLPFQPGQIGGLVEREKTGAMFLDPDVARSSVAPRAPRRQRRLCKGPGVFARLLCMRDSQPRLYKRTPRGYEREPMEDSRGGCLGMAKLVSVGTQTDNDGGCHQHTSVRREVWYPDGVYEDDSFDPDAVEYLVDAHTLQRTWSFTGGSVARACPDILVETYICYAVAHQLVHRAYDWVWVLLRLLFAYASSRGGVKAVQWLLRRGTLWGPHMGMPARMAVSEGLPRWAVLSTAGMVVAGMACAWFLQGWVTRLLRPSYEGWVSGKALTLVAEAGYSPDVLADFARDVGDRSDADTVARQVGPGILCPCAARMDCPLSGSAPMVAMHCEYRSGSALASVWESSRTSYYKAMEWERERRYEERPGLLHIVGSRQEKALEWMG